MAKTTGMHGLKAAVCGLAVALLALFGAGAAYADEAEVAGDPYEHAVEVDLPDGSYTIDVVKEGGSGKADVESPARLDVAGGHGVATIVWSSSNYDYMLVDGLKYLNQAADVNDPSTFTIPVLAYGEPMAVVGDTTAMGTPHEIDYTLTFDLDSVVAGAPAAAETSSSAAADTSAETSAPASAPASEPATTTTAPEAVNPAFIVVGIVVVLAIGIAIGVVRGRKNR